MDLNGFDDLVVGENAAPGGAWVEDGAATDDGAWVEDGVAADFGVVADDGAEFFEACGDGAGGGIDGDFAAIEFDVGENGTCAEVGAVAEDGVADVIEVGDLGEIEDDGVFEFGGIAEDATGADDDIFADVAAVTDFAIFADPRGAFDHGALFDDCALADEDGAADEGFADEAAVDGRFEAELEVAGDLGEGLPSVGGIFEEHAMLGVIEVKEVFSRKGHGWVYRGRVGVRQPLGCVVAEEGCDVGRNIFRCGSGARREGLGGFDFFGVRRGFGRGRERGGVRCGRRDCGGRSKRIWRGG